MSMVRFPHIRVRPMTLVVLGVILSSYTLCIVVATALNEYVHRTLPELAFWFIPLTAASVITAISIYVWRRTRETDMLRYEFITIVAHKFRTPLTHIKWVCEELVSTEKDQSRKEYLLMMYTSNNNLIDFTGMIIQAADNDVASGRAYVFTPLQLKSLISEVAGDVAGAYHTKNLKLSISVPEAAVINADAHRIRFAFQTLLENAQAYTPEGGSVTLSATEEKGKIVIKVSDTGIGIDPRDLPKLFSKFYRTDNAMHADTEGFGIGLYLVKTIIDRHGGKISVFSGGENAGTTFTIRLPLVGK